MATLASGCYFFPFNYSNAPIPYTHRPVFDHRHVMPADADAITTILPFGPSMQIGRCPDGDLIAAGICWDSLIIARLDDSLKVKWSVSYPNKWTEKGDPHSYVDHPNANGLNPLTILCDGRTIAVLRTEPEWHAAMPHDAVLLDALTGALLKRQMLRGHVMGDASGSGMVLSPDSSFFLLYSIDETGWRRQGKYMVYAWLYANNGDSVAEGEIEITLTREERENDAGVVRKIALDNQGRVLQANFRNRSTIQMMRHDLRAMRTDTLSVEVPVLSFDDEDTPLDSVTMVVDAIDRVHLLGARKESASYFESYGAHVGELVGLVAVRFDFDRKLAEVVIDAEMTPELVESVIDDDVLDSYNLKEAWVTPAGGYLFVAEHQRGHGGYSHRPRGPVSMEPTYHPPAVVGMYELVLIAYDSTGKRLWQRLVKKSQKHDALTYHTKIRGSIPSVSDTTSVWSILFLDEENNGGSRIDVRLNNGHVTNPARMFWLRNDARWGISPALWLSDSRIVVTTRGEYTDDMAKVAPQLCPTSPEEDPYDDASQVHAIALPD